MNFTATAAILLGLFSMTFMINLFFGHLRSKTRKFSIRWALCIHLPIPLIYFARVSSNISFAYVPLFVAAAVMGQILGGKIEF